MKKASLALLIGATLVITACGNDKKENEENASATSPANASAYTTETSQHSYALGASMGKFAKERIAAQTELGIEGDNAALTAGFNDAFNGESVFSDAEIENFIKAYSEKFQVAQQAEQQASSAAAMAAGKAYLEENAAREGVVTTASGLQYEVLTPGTGASPSAQDTVKVHYHGTLIDGTVFDSSVQRQEPAEFPLNRVISGWTEGLQLMKVGGKYRFVIPSELAYGSRATGAIKPNSTLIFEVELLDITPFES